MNRVLLIALLAGTVAHGQTRSFDIIIHNGTVIDGSGNPRYDADVGIRNGFIAAIGDLDDATATTQHRRARTVRHARLHQHSQPRRRPTPCRRRSTC